MHVGSRAATRTGRGRMIAMVLGILCLLAAAAMRIEAATVQPPAVVGAADPVQRSAGAGAADPMLPSPASVSSPEPPHTPAAVASEPRRLAFRHDDGPGVGALLVRMAGGLVLMAALALVIALLAKRYMPAVRGYSADGQSRVQLLESRRITPKLTLFVVEFEGRRLLLAQSGDRVTEVGASPGGVTPHA